MPAPAASGAQRGSLAPARDAPSSPLDLSRPPGDATSRRVAKARGELASRARGRAGYRFRPGRAKGEKASLLPFGSVRPLVCAKPRSCPRIAAIGGRCYSDSESPARRAPSTAERTGRCNRAGPRRAGAVYVCVSDGSTVPIRIRTRFLDFHGRHGSTLVWLRWWSRAPGS